MIRTSVLALVTVAAVTSAAMVGTGAMSTSGMDSISCTCSTVDLESGSATLVVLVNGTDGASANVNQRIEQVNDRTRVRTTIEFEYSETSVAIAGTTVANGSLLLNVTRNGEVVNESIVANANEEQTLVFHVDANGEVSVTREDSHTSCTSACEVSDVDVDVAPVEDTGDDFDGGVNVGDDVEVNVGDDVEDGVEVSVGDGVEVNVSQNGSADVAKNAGCAEPPDGDDSLTDISRPPERSSDVSQTGVGILQVVVRPPAIDGLAKPDRTDGCGSTTGSAVNHTSVLAGGPTHGA